MRRAAAPLVAAGLATLAVAFLAPLAPLGERVRPAAPPRLRGQPGGVRRLVAAPWPGRPGSRGPRRDVRAGDVPRSAEPAPVPARLRELERLVAAALESALDAEARLRPELRELACALLWARRRVEVDPGAGGGRRPGRDAG